MSSAGAGAVAGEQDTQLEQWELEVVTRVFRSLETGLREGTIHAKDLHTALKMLGLNPLGAVQHTD